jgi:cytochrome d ubiquinol oxidase subunit I
VVQGLLLTKNGNSPSVSLTEVAISLGIFWVLYIALGIVWGFLMLRYARRGLDLEHDISDPLDDPDRSAPQAPALTY